MKAKFMISLLVMIWVGMILAIGMESVVKFSAHSLAKPVAFDVGRVVFGAFNKVQLAMLMVIILLMRFAHLAKLDKLLIALVSIILLLQFFWLFPFLSERVDLILAGVKPLPSYKHGLYGVLELIKLMVLFMMGIRLSMAAPLKQR